eukprot:2866007-Ditylum_brightwellii.AAC.1
MSVYLPSVKYPLAATCLSIKQCQTIDSIVLPSIDQCLGFSKGFPHTVITGLTYFGEMGLQITEGEQEVEKICAVIKHVGTQNQAGTLFYIMLTWDQLQT